MDTYWINGIACMLITLSIIVFRTSFTFWKLESRTFAFLISITSCIFFGWYFYLLGFYKSLFIQVFSICLNVYGMYSFSQDQIMKRLTFKNIYVLLILLLVCICIKTPLMDSYLFVMSIFSSYLLITKIPFCWITWFIYDLSCVIFFYSRLEYIGSLCYIITMTFSVLNYLQWKKELNEKCICQN